MGSKNATVTSKGQVTIPKSLRERLGISQGTVLSFRQVDGTLIVSKVMVRDPVDAAFGLLRDGRRSDDVLRELRDPG